MSKETGPSRQVLPTDRVLSVRQPEAQLLVTRSSYSPRIPEKWLENRSWRPTIPFGSQILIHASSTKEYSDEELLEYHNLKNVSYSAIIGYVTVIGCEHCPKDDSNKTPWENYHIRDAYVDSLREMIRKHTGDIPPYEERMGYECFSRNAFNWVCVNPVLLDRPIPCPGKLKIWTLPENLK